MSILYDCIVGPALYRIFDIPYRNYAPYNLERYSDRFIRILQLCKTILTYVSPLLIYNLINQYYNRTTVEETVYTSESNIDSFISFLANSSYIRLSMGLSSCFIISYILRGFSRSTNPAYLQFIRTFKLARTPLLTDDHRDRDELSRKIIEARELVRQKYDFEYEYWPVDFKWSDGKYVHERPAKLLPLNEASHETLKDSPLLNMVSYLVASSIGRMLLYPGSVSLLQKVLENNLINGRRFLIENYNAQRFKLLARDDNHIDTIFVDKRNPNVPEFRGNTLVITCEGNAGFYEIGSLMTPLNLSYSILGWNHPGFGGSSGTPFPQNDINAMEVVVNFAVTKLNFKLENILIYGWSIGGFPAAWAVSNYPEVKGVILDASFDDVLPLARSRMLPFMAPIVDSTIRHHFNLNVSSYLNRYNGPVRFIRRLQDEIIPIDPERPLFTNRGNYLLIKLLKTRFPQLMSHDDVKDEVEQFLHTENPNYLTNKINDAKVCEVLSKYMDENTNNEIGKYPILIDVNEKSGVDMLIAQQIILFMCRELMTQFNSTHCTPLPESLFKEPFDLFRLIIKKS